LKVIVLSQDEKHIWVDYPSFRIVCPEGEKGLLAKYFPIIFG